jgi:hypothetical protein
MQWGHGRWPCSTSVYIEKEHNKNTFPTPSEMSLTTPALVVVLLPYALTRRACTLFKSIRRSRRIALGMFARPDCSCMHSVP